MTSTNEPQGAATTAPRGALRRPADLARNIDVSGLVDTEGGLLDRVIFTDYILYGFGGTTPAGDVLLDKAGLQEYIWVDLSGEVFLMVNQAAYNRMMR